MDAELYDNPEAIFKRIQFCHDLAFECVIPAKIVRTYSDHTADAQPLIKLVSDMASIEQVPIRVTTLWNFHGDFEVHHPLNVGDTGWLIASDRNTDLVKQYNCELDETRNQGAQEPNKDLNLHRYRWGFFIPDRWDRQLRPKQTVPEQLRDCFYIKDRNGNVELFLDEDGHVVITAKSAAEIYSDLFVHGDVSMDGEMDVKGDAHFRSNVKIDGEALVKELRVLHDAKFDHDVTIDGSVYVNGKNSRVNDMTEQEITCVTNVTQDAQTKQTILTLEKMKVFRTKKDHDRNVTITVPESGGGGGGETKDCVTSLNFNNGGAWSGRMINDIKVSAEDKVGLNLNKNDQQIDIDFKDRPPNESLAVRKFQASSNIVGRVFGTKDISIVPDDTTDTPGIEVSGDASEGTVKLLNTGVTKIVPGTNITVSPEAGTGVVKISATAKDETVYEAGNAIKFSDTTDGKKKIDNTGVTSIAFGNNAQIANGQLKIVEATGSGISVTGSDFKSGGDYTDGTCTIDLNGRDQNDEFGIHEVKSSTPDADGNKKVVAKVLSTADFEVGGSGGTVTVTGTDGISAICTSGEIKFASAADSNVVVKATTNDAGDVTVTVGVYYV